MSTPIDDERILRVGDRLVRMRVTFEDLGPAAPELTEADVAELVSLVEALHGQVRALRDDRLAAKLADAPTDAKVH